MKYFKNPYKTYHIVKTETLIGKGILTPQEEKVALEWLEDLKEFMMNAKNGGGVLTPEEEKAELEWLKRLNEFQANAKNKPKL